MKPGALELAIAIYMRPATAEHVARVRAAWAGPFRAVPAGEDDDFPWIVVDATGINCFGRLWTKAYAQHVAEWCAREDSNPQPSE